MQALLFLFKPRRARLALRRKLRLDSHKNSSLRIEGEGDVAVFCFDGKAEGVSIKGLKYELDDAEISLRLSSWREQQLCLPRSRDKCQKRHALIMYDIKVNEID